jgi:hypothetical protein
MILLARRKRIMARGSGAKLGNDNKEKCEKRKAAVVLPDEFVKAVQQW